MAVENRGPELAAVVIALLVFTFITVALRVYTMGFLMKRFFAEDYLAVVTFVSSSSSPLGTRYSNTIRYSTQPSPSSRF